MNALVGVNFCIKNCALNIDAFVQTFERSPRTCRTPGACQRRQRRSIAYQFPRPSRSTNATGSFAGAPFHGFVATKVHEPPYGFEHSFGLQARRLILVSRSGCCVMRQISGENLEGILQSAIGKTVYAGHVRAGPGQGRANSAHAHRGVSGLGFRRLLRPARQAGAVPVGHAVSDQPISRIWRRIGSGTERQSRQPLDSSTPAARPSCALKMGFLLAKTDPDTRLSKVNRGEGFA